METNTQQERAKRLEQQAREYLMQSNDPIFTRYLQQLLPRIQRQPEYVEQLQAELDKSVEFWYQRQYHRRQPPENSRQPGNHRHSQWGSLPCNRCRHR